MMMLTRYNTLWYDDAYKI